MILARLFPREARSATVVAKRLTLDVSQGTRIARPASGALHEPRKERASGGKRRPAYAHKRLTILPAISLTALQSCGVLYIHTRLYVK